jgi:hypothetical protein
MNQACFSNDAIAVFGCFKLPFAVGKFNLLFYAFTNE